MKKTMMLICCMAIFLSVNAQQTIVKGGKAKARIVVANADDATTEAAELLQDFVERISDAKMPITDGAPRRNDIVIGHKAPETVGEDGYRLLTKDGVLHIQTGGDKGAAYGVVALLEKYLDVHYYAKDFYSLTRQSTITLPLIDESSTPAFRYRQSQTYANEDKVFRTWFALEEPSDEFIDNMWVHTFNRILPSSRFGKSHPEYYSLINGERRPGDHSQWCLSNPAVLEACIAQLDSIFRANPDKSMISVSQNDGNDTYCHCDDCKAIYEEEGAVSGAYVRFMNQLAERFPDKQISTLAYLFTMTPPKKVRPLPNVNIMLCDIDCKREVSLTDNASGRFFVEAMEGWSAISNNIFVWDYGINFDNVVSPFPNFHIIQPNIQLFHKNNTTMHFFQINSTLGTDFAEMRTYMGAKLMWNPYQDADSLMRTFMEGYYGAATPYLYQYQKLLQGALLASGKELWIYDSPITHKDGMLTPLLIKEYDRLFDLAEDAVKDNPVLLDHVRISRLTLQYSKLEIARTDASSDVAEMEAQLNLFESRTRHYAIPTLNERNNRPAEYCELYRKRFLPQTEKSKALGAKVIFLANEDTIRGGKPDDRYLPISETALTDGLYGGTTYVESWVGWCGRDADFVLDLGEEKEFSRIETDFLHQLGAWILLPKGGRYDISNDGETWQEFGGFGFEEDRDVSVKFVSGIVKKSSAVKARYIRVHVDTIGLCPDWHYGVGYPAWFFIDEVNVY